MRAPITLCILFAACNSSSAAVYTVGPGGTHANLDAALATAAVTAGVHEVRIAAGNHSGDTLQFFSGEVEVDVSGGWDAVFGSRAENASLTVLQGTGAAPVLQVTGDGGRLALRNLTLTSPDSQQNEGTCLLLSVLGTHDFSLSDSVVRNCEGRGVGLCQGNGIRAVAGGAAVVDVVRTHVHGNRCEMARTDPDQRVAGSGTGIHLSATDDAQVQLRGNVVADNVANSFGAQSDGIGLYVAAYDSADVVVERNEVLGNRVVGEAVGAWTPVSQAWGVLLVAGATGGDASVVARGNVIAENRFDSPESSGAHVLAVAYGQGSVDLGDSIVAGGVGGPYGLLAQADGADAVVHLTNLTVADNAGNGIRTFASTGVVTLYNSIASGNGQPVQLGSEVDQDYNLLDLHAGFVDAAAGDYRLTEASPALDIGTLAPPGGLGSTDVGGGARVSGPGVDLGAWEAVSAAIFADGFE